jgi:hypothetical protein
VGANHAAISGVMVIGRLTDPAGLRLRNRKKNSANAENRFVQGRLLSNFPLPPHVFFAEHLCQKSGRRNLGAI